MSASDPEGDPETETKPEQEDEDPFEEGAETPQEGVIAEGEPESEVEPGPDREAEEGAILSEKERQNEDLNEKDNCSASSISSASSTLEREEKLVRDNETGKVEHSPH